MNFVGHHPSRLALLIYLYLFQRFFFFKDVSIFSGLIILNGSLTFTSSEVQLTSEAVMLLSSQKRRVSLLGECGSSHKHLMRRYETY